MRYPRYKYELYVNGLIKGIYRTKLDAVLRAVKSEGAIEIKEVLI